MGGGWHFGPRRYRGGGCCLGNMIGMLFFILILVLMLVFAMCNGVTVTQEGHGYNEDVFQDYANSQYQQVFGSSAYEDNLLIVFLTDEYCEDFYYIAWVGDHIDSDIRLLLGDNDTALGWAMSRCISYTSYRYSLDSDLALVMDTMAEEISSLGLDSSFTCTENHSGTASRLVNYSNVELTEQTVNDSLAAFTETTGIPTVIVVEDMADVFGGSETETSISAGSVLMFVLIVGAVAVVVWLITKKKKADPGTPKYDFDDKA